MFSLLGAPALSQFRLDKLLQRLLQAAEPRVSAISARHGSISSMPARPLDENELEVLLEAAHLRAAAAPASGDRGQPLLVTPRVGTVSPWSSKATDIAKVCGLEAVTRWSGARCISSKVTALSTDSSGVAARPDDRVGLGGIDRTGGIVPCRGGATLARRGARADGAWLRWRAPIHSGAWRCRGTRSTTWSPPSASSGVTPPTWN